MCLTPSKGEQILSYPIQKGEYEPENALQKGVNIEIRPFQRVQKSRTPSKGGHFQESGTSICTPYFLEWGGAGDRYAPHVIHGVKGVRCKWVTDEYVSLSHLRDRLKNKADKQKTDIDWRRYRAVRNHLNNLRTMLKRRYYQNGVLRNKKKQKNYGKY